MTSQYSNPVDARPRPASHGELNGRGMWLVLAAAVLWGTTGTAQAFAPPGVSPLAVGAVRLAIGGSALMVIALLRRQLRTQNWPKWAASAGICGVAAYQVCFFAGVARTGVAVGTVVAIGSAPIFAGLFGWFVLRERPGWRWLGATTLAISGCTVLVLAGGEIRLDAAGILLATGAGAAYAAYTIANKRLLGSQPPDAVAAVTFFGAALLLSPLLLFVDIQWLAEPRGMLVALELGLLATTLAYVLYTRGLQTVPAATAVTLALMEPLTAATLGIVVLGERPSLPALLGMALILAGLLVLTIRRGDS